MESTIRLCYSPLPGAALRLSSGAKGAAAARASTFHLRFSHASLCLSHFSTRHPVARSFGHVNCMLERLSVPSKNEESDNKILRGVTGISLVLACVLGLFNFGSKMNPKFNTAYAAWPYGPSPTGMPHKAPGGGEDALESLLKMMNAVPSKQTLPKLSQLPSKDEIDALKLYAVGLSKSGKPGEALKILENAYERVSKEELSEPEHNLGMALVELLIFQGNFVEANKWLDRQLDQQLSSVVDDPEKLNYEKKIVLLLDSPLLLSKAEFLLYKAIIHAMLDNKEAAKKWGEAFIKTVTGTE